jgi:hypothetical protein
MPIIMFLFALGARSFFVRLPILIGHIEPLAQHVAHHPVGLAYQSVRAARAWNINLKIANFVLISLYMPKVTSAPPAI